MGTLLVFGGSGFVGGHLLRAAHTRGWQAYAVSRRGGAGALRADIADAAAVEAAIEAARPAAVANLAAIADIDQAEREQELAWRTNCEGARHVAEGCARRGVRHVFLSSDAVFDGRAGPYREEDPTAPVSCYGRTKAAAERAVLAAQPQAAVVRVSLVLGFPLAAGNSYLARLEERLRAGREVPCSAEEVRTPVDVATLAEALLELLAGDLAGILHVAGTGWADRCELARRLARGLGYPEALVMPQAAVAPGATRAPRHRNGMLDVSKARRLLRTPLLPLDGTVQRAIGERPLAGQGGEA